MQAFSINVSQQDAAKQVQDKEEQEELNMAAQKLQTPPAQDEQLVEQENDAFDMFMGGSAKAQPESNSNNQYASQDLLW